MRARLVAPILLAARLAAAGPEAPPAPPSDDYERLGRLERLEVDAVLADQHLRIVSRPEGRTIARVIVAPRDVFSRDDGAFLRFFNIFHVTTRPAAIERELLFSAGEPWRQEIIDETLRHIREPLFHNVVVILPVEPQPGPDGRPPAGTVDALVVVRDVWSLRLNTRYDVQGLEIINLQVSVSENNFLGWRKRLAVAMIMDQGDIELGPSYYDPNLLGTRLTLLSLARAIFSRDSLDLEGSHSETTLAYPFWSLRTRWGGSLTVAHFTGVHRSFRGTALRTYDDPDTAAVEAVPWVYRRRELTTEARVSRSFGTHVITRVGGGHELSLSRPALTTDFPDAADSTLAAAFRRDVLPRSELSSALFLRWQLFTPVYAAMRDLETFDFREDYQIGPSLEARVSLALDELGGDRDFLRLTGAARWTSDWGHGLYRASAGYTARLQDGHFIDRTTSALLYAATPRLARAGRLVAALQLDLLHEDQDNRFFVLGASNGLRGFPINEFTGQARLVGHLEARTLPLHIFFLRLGAVAFWDFGHAAETVADLRLQHGVGAGGRLLIPQLDPLVIRFDWAFALTGSAAGWPGRVSLGVEQVF